MITLYQLWFRYGAPYKTSPPLLVALLQDANLLDLVNQKGEIKCVLKTKNRSDVYSVIKAYNGRWLPYQLWYYFKAVKRWKNVLKPLEKVS